MLLRIGQIYEIRELDIDGLFFVDCFIKITKEMKKDTYEGFIWTEECDETRDVEEKRVEIEISRSRGRGGCIIYGDENCQNVQRWFKTIKLRVQMPRQNCTS